MIKLSLTDSDCDLLLSLSGNDCKEVLSAIVNGESGDNLTGIKELVFRKINKGIKRRKKESDRVKKSREMRNVRVNYAKKERTLQPSQRETKESDFSEDSVTEKNPPSDQEKSISEGRNLHVNYAENMRTLHTSLIKTNENEVPDSLNTGEDDFHSCGSSVAEGCNVREHYAKNVRNLRTEDSTLPPSSSPPSPPFLPPSSLPPEPPISSPPYNPPSTTPSPSPNPTTPVTPSPQPTEPLSPPEIPDTLSAPEAKDEPKKPTKRGKKKTTTDEKPKVQWAEFVFLTNDEYNKLLATYGAADTNRLIEILDNYKGQSGRKYRSDYRAILNWVIPRLEEEKAKKEARERARRNGSGNIFLDMLRKEETKR